jgi:hypothetical protein
MDHQTRLRFLEQQNKTRLLMAKKSLEEQDTEIRMVTSLLDQLNIAHTSVKELLENFPLTFELSRISSTPFPQTSRLYKAVKRITMRRNPESKLGRTITTS